MVNLDIDLEVLVKTIGTQEADNGLGILVILVLGGLHRLGLNQEGALKALGTGIVTRCREHLGQVVLLALHLGIKQALVALTATPEDVTGTAQLDGGINGVLDLDGGTCHNIEIGIGGGTVHVTLVAKHVGSAPQQLDTRCLHLLQGIVGNSLHAGFILLDGIGLLNEVHIVEAEILDAQLLHDFKTGIHLVLGTLNRVLGFVPFIGTGLSAKLVSAGLS